MGCPRAPGARWPGPRSLCLRWSVLGRLGRGLGRISACLWVRARGARTGLRTPARPDAVACMPRLGARVCWCARVSSGLCRALGAPRACDCAARRVCLSAAVSGCVCQLVFVPGGAGAPLLPWPGGDPMTSLSPSRPDGGRGSLQCGAVRPGAAAVSSPYLGGQPSGLGGAGAPWLGTKCLAEGKRLQMRGGGRWGRWGWVSCMPGSALASVSVCPCLSASLSNRCRLLFLADHLTPSSPGFLPECLGGGLGGRLERGAGGWERQEGWAGWDAEGGSGWERLREREYEGWGERWRMNADGPRDAGGGWGFRSVD